MRQFLEVLARGRLPIVQAFGLAGVERHPHVLKEADTALLPEAVYGLPLSQEALIQSRRWRGYHTVRRSGTTDPMDHSRRHW
jgi:hypothetical protein